jgi:hypothetical protein
MALLGNAVLAVWNDVDPDIEDDLTNGIFGNTFRNAPWCLG